jgi:GT2 family glycosyltransferase
MEKVSVIIPTYYRYPELYNLVDALSHQTTIPDEILIVDQTPIVKRPDNYNQWILNNNIVLLNQSRPSLSTGRNVAALKAKYDILIFLDDDIEITDSFIDSHLSVMENQSVDAVSGGTTIHDKLPDEYPWTSETLDPIRFISAAPNYTYQGMMMSITSGNFSIKRDIFLSSGGFDDECPRMVDFELGYRLFRSGAKLFYSSLPFAKHLRAKGGSRHFSQKDYKVMAPIYIHMKHFPGWAYQQYILRHIRLHVLKKRFILTPWKILKELYALKGMIRESKQRLSHFNTIRINNRIQKYKNMGIGCNCHPMMTEYEINILKELLRLVGNGVRVLEYGSGNSTLYFSQYLESLRYEYTWESVEYDKSWQKHVKERLETYKIRGAKISLVDFKNIDPRKEQLSSKVRDKYIEDSVSMSDGYDIVLIDGRYRSRAYKHVFDNSPNKTIIIVMDSERKYYQKKYIENYKLHYTGLAVFYPNNGYNQKRKYIQVTCKDNSLWNKLANMLSVDRAMVN